jgi:hypothetical protein
VLDPNRYHSQDISGHVCRDPEHFFAPFHSFYLTVGIHDRIQAVDSNAARFLWGVRCPAQYLHIYLFCEAYNTSVTNKAMEFYSFHVFCRDVHEFDSGRPRCGERLLLIANFNTTFSHLTITPYKPQSRICPLAQRRLQRAADDQLV